MNEADTDALYPPAHVNALRGSQARVIAPARLILYTRDGRAVARWWLDDYLLPCFRWHGTSIIEVSPSYELERFAVAYRAATLNAPALIPAREACWSCRRGAFLRARLRMQERTELTPAERMWMMGDYQHPSGFPPPPPDPHPLDSALDRELCELAGVPLTPG